MVEVLGEQAEESQQNQGDNQEHRYWTADVHPNKL